MNFASIALGLWLSLGLNVLSARATTVLPMTAKALAKRAPIIIYGKVVQIDVDSQSGFRTAVVEALETARAPEAFRRQRDFYVPLLNRAIPHSDQIEVVSAAPELKVLEELVLFLRPVSELQEGVYRRTDGQRLFSLEGFFQGKMQVIQDKRGVRRVVAWNEAKESGLTPSQLLKQKTTPRFSLQQKSTAVVEVAPEKVDQLLTLDTLLNLARAPAEAP